MAAKAKKESSGVLRVVCEIAFGMIAGVLIAAVWLALKPVKVVDAAPALDREITDRHEVVYVRGKSSGGRSAQYTQKQRTFLERTPGHVQVVEQDINRWIGGAYGAADLSVAYEPLGLAIHRKPPLARLDGSLIELGMEMQINWADSKKKLVVQTVGEFEQRDGRQVFTPHKVYLGSCPLPVALGGGLLVSRLAAGFQIPDEVRSARSAVSNVSIDASRMVLEISGVPDAATASNPSAPAPVAATPPPAIAPTSAPAIETAVTPPVSSETASDSPILPSVAAVVSAASDVITTAAAAPATIKETVDNTLALAEARAAETDAITATADEATTPAPQPDSGSFFPTTELAPTTGLSSTPAPSATEAAAQ